MAAYVVTASADVADAFETFLAAHSPAKLGPGTWLIEIKGDPHALFTTLTACGGNTGDVSMLEITGKIWGRGQYRDSSMAWVMARSS